MQEKSCHALILFRNGLTPGQECADAKSGMQDTDQADGGDEASGKEIHDKMLRLFQVIGTHQHLDAENEKEKGKNADRDVADPPEPGTRLSVKHSFFNPPCERPCINGRYQSKRKWKNVPPSKGTLFSPCRRPRLLWTRQHSSPPVQPFPLHRAVSRIR